MVSYKALNTCLELMSRKLEKAAKQYTKSK